MTQRVTLQIENQVAVVTLSRPEKLNALDLPMFEAIVDAQQQLSANLDVRVVLLTGEGADFCSGLDVKALMKDRGGMRKLLWKWLPWRSNLAQKVSTGWRDLGVPVIAVLKGRCWGGGLQIALGADFRIAHPDASLSIMEGKWGLIPDMGGTLAVRELMRRDQAMKLTMTAAEVDGSEAHQLGLVTEVHADPDDRARQFAAELMKKSPDALAAMKKLLERSWNGSRGMALLRESIYQIRVITGANQRIAVRREMGEDQPFRSRRKS